MGSSHQLAQLTPQLWRLYWTLVCALYEMTFMNKHTSSNHEFLQEMMKPALPFRYQCAQFHLLMTTLVCAVKWHKWRRHDVWLNKFRRCLRIKEEEETQEAQTFPFRHWVTWDPPTSWPNSLPSWGHCTGPWYVHSMKWHSWTSIHLQSWISCRRWWNQHCLSATSVPNSITSWLHWYVLLTDTSGEGMKYG